MPYYPATAHTFKKELLRPWKLLSLAAGTALLIIGARIYTVPDWDIPISIIMAVSAYVFSPWCVDAVVYVFRNRPGNWAKILFKAIIVAYVCISLEWEVYNIARIGVETTYSIYLGNLKTSSILFIMTGIIWRYEGTLLSMFRLKRA